MIRIFKNAFLLLFSFVIGFELINIIKPDDNVINTNDEGFSYVDINNQDNVYFLGDSYASTNYAEFGYPLIFRDYFKSRGFNFIDLSRAGTVLLEHKEILDSISQFNPKLIVYFYNISDINALIKNNDA